MYTHTQNNYLRGIEPTNRYQATHVQSNISLELGTGDV